MTAHLHKTLKMISNRKSSKLENLQIGLHFQELRLVNLQCRLRESEATYGMDHQINVSRRKTIEEVQFIIEDLHNQLKGL